MSLKETSKTAAFTFPEMLIALTIGSIILAGIMAGSVSLTKSFNAVDNFFSTHMQQVRIIEYLNRDVKRSYIVTSSPDLKTVTCVIPNYLNGGVRVTPTVKSTETGVVVSYPYSRTVSDAITTANSTTLTSASANFSATDVGATVAGVNIPASTTIQSVTNSTTIVMSASATASTSGATVTFGATTVVYSISGNSIVRTENGVVTNIASSTDQLLPQTTDVTMSNTEYTTTSVTFQPILTSGNATAERSGTTVYTTSYLRNKRRG